MSAWHLLIVGLWGAVIVLAGLVALLYRQFGLVYLAQNAARTRDGLPLGGEAPNWSAADQDGIERTPAEYVGRPFVLVFAEPGCAPCRKLMPELELFAVERRGQVDVVVIGSADSALNRSMAQPHVSVLTQEDDVVASRFRVAATPFCYLIDDAGRLRDKGIVNFKVQLDAMFESLASESAKQEVII
jgi:methylamine dehydrogenase accessory protein MauD